ncbi:tetratricopeptide repeat protein [Winogradskyella maritima]|uniref:Tetratricopeptide repeat protein n=1 Tax=Winogradskyella maritima TaxID=1517766 RepID=A0ABV8AIE6_9FLAO|nr:tetratricopeptide repeat protein [Winogradskyella maritima]
MRFFIALLVFSFGLQAQDVTNEKQLVKKAKKATELVYEGNELLQDNQMVEAEMEFRKALSEKKDNVAGAYNLAHTYYKNGSYDEALFRVEQAAKSATNKSDKHKAYHNIGNILMQNKQCKAAVEAFKNALRNNPTDDETRYNLALAQECAKEEDGSGEDNKEDENQQDDQDKKEQDQQKNKDDQQQEKDKKEDEGDKDKKKGEEEEDDKGKPKDEKDEKNKGDENKDKQKQKPQPGKMSPQQIKNILEAMSNQEQKVQEKINAQKQKGAKVKTEKDW